MRSRHEALSGARSLAGPSANWRAYVLASALGTALLVACGGSASDADTTHSGGVPPAVAGTVPVDQQAAMADGEVSVAEYQAAFGKFEDCVTAGGGTVVGVRQDPASGLVTFGIDAASGRLGSPGRPGTGLAGRCYESEFAYVDQAFSTGPVAQAAESEQELQLFRQEQAPCLELNGVAIPGDLAFGTDEWNELYQQFLDLASKAKCPGITVSP